MHMLACAEQRTQTAVGFTMTLRSAKTPLLAMKSNEPERVSKGYLWVLVVVALVTVVLRLPGELDDDGMCGSGAMDASDRMRIDSETGGLRPICILTKEVGKTRVGGRRRGSQDVSGLPSRDRPKVVRGV